MPHLKLFLRNSPKQHSLANIMVHRTTKELTHDTTQTKSFFDRGHRARDSRHTFLLHQNQIWKSMPRQNFGRCCHVRCPRNNTLQAYAVKIRNHKEGRWKSETHSSNEFCDINIIDDGKYIHHTWHTSQRTVPVYTTKAHQLMLFREIMYSILQEWNSST